MRKLCTHVGCKTIVNVDDGQSPRCDKHQRTYQPVPLEDRKKKYTHHYNEQGQSIYGMYRWKKLRGQKAKLNPLCEHCELNGVARAVEEVDHVIEIEDGGEMWDIDNLQSLCKRHHIIKTNQAKKLRQNKKDIYGYLINKK